MQFLMNILIAFVFLLLTVIYLVIFLYLIYYKLYLLRSSYFLLLLKVLFIKQRNCIIVKVFIMKYVKFNDDLREILLYIQLLKIDLILYYS